MLVFHTRAETCKVLLQYILQSNVCNSLLSMLHSEILSVLVTFTLFCVLSELKNKYTVDMLSFTCGPYKNI